MSESPSQVTRRALVQLPIARLLKRWTQRSSMRQAAEVDEADADAIVNRWLANRRQIRAIAADAGIDLLFVWQPIPGFGYEQEFHLFASDAPSPVSTRGYEAVDDLRRSDGEALQEDFLWLADMQRARSEPLYVDQVHYTGAFSRDIAMAIVDRLVSDGCPGAASEE